MQIVSSGPSRPQQAGPAATAALGERQTKDLKVAYSIHAHRTTFASSPSRQCAFFSASRTTLLAAATKPPQPSTAEALPAPARNPLLVHMSQAVPISAQKRTETIPCHRCVFLNNTTYNAMEESMVSYEHSQPINNTFKNHLRITPWRKAWSPMNIHNQSTLLWPLLTSHSRDVPHLICTSSMLLLFMF
uniref:Uncharacterized protein n=1 Tax=Physcomitrium patens TaxID=3218 RepID=A0A2K1K7C8_PHYPA|nr:hypothetical protein PHYPA_011571 [Physcomitrium patens]